VRTDAADAPSGALRDPTPGVGDHGVEIALRRYRGAIVGLGAVALQSHLPAFRHSPALARRFQLVRAADPARAADGTVDGLRVVADAERLLHDAALDFVDVATPSASHPAMARWALERGLHVLCEKPVATRRADALALAALARRMGRVLVPCHQYRFNPVWRRIRGWLAAGALGHWHLAEVAVYRTAADRGASAAAVPWRGRRGESGGGVLVDHGTHLVYTLLDLGGMPERVSAWTGRLAHREYDVEDTAQLRLEYPDRLATVFLTWAARRRETRVHVSGERGAITWTDGVLALERDGETRSFDFTRELDKSAYAGWFAELFLAFATTLDAGAESTQARAARADVVRVATVLEAAYGSARLGAPAPVPADCGDDADDGE
jgi:predicted dehydrogenase